MSNHNRIHLLHVGFHGIDVGFFDLRDERYTFEKSISKMESLPLPTLHNNR